MRAAIAQLPLAIHVVPEAIGTIEIVAAVVIRLPNFDGGALQNVAARIEHAPRDGDAQSGFTGRAEHLKELVQRLSALGYLE